MSRKYFGTDGVRGKVGETPITPEFVMHLGFSAGEVLVRRSAMPRGEHPAVLIGKDTRVSGYMLEAALEAGFAAAGVAYLTRALRLQAGVVISASHNPHQDNGIKFFSAEGSKLPDAVEADIESRLDRPIQCKDSVGLGKARRVEDARGRYIEFCKSTFPSALDLRGLKLVIDCAHGATYDVAPHVFHELGADVETIGADPDGFNINDGAGTVHPQALQAAVAEHRADLGIALDGDGDRLIMVDGEGRLYDGDELLFVIARERAKDGGLKGVAGTLMTNLALEHALEKMGVSFGRAKVGDRYVLEMLQEKSWQLGGENSGHIICLDKHTTGDGIVSALQVLSAVRKSGATLGELCRGLSLYPQHLVNVRVAKGFDWQKMPAIVKAKSEAERMLGARGRVLLRPSGTEPVLRVMVEGQDHAEVQRLAKLISDSVLEAA
jgi:phosphoglucosamine mutase